MTLRIGHERIEVADIAEARRVYCERRDESGEGASTFPRGQVGELSISYNGRVWDAAGCEVKVTC